MFRTRLIPLARRSTTPTLTRPFSLSASRHQAIPIEIRGEGTNTQQKISVKDKPYTFQADTYTLLGGQDAYPSPVSYALASLSSCNQVTGSLVARDHGIKLGHWDVEVVGMLPTDVLVGGEQGNPNWEKVTLKAKVQTNIEGGNDAEKFRFFVSEVERRCPITQLFKLSGVEFVSVWENVKL